MELNRYKFEVLAYIENKGKCKYDNRTFADTLRISGSKITECMDELKEAEFIKNDGEIYEVSDKGYEALEPYKVKRAVVLAAGFGSRMVPVTLTTPKPLVRVNGPRIIDQLFKALLAVGITDITVVRGYKKEVFDELKKDYPFVKFVDNDVYDKTNNISSAIAAINNIDNCYICEADLLISNPGIIKKYQYSSNYLGSYSVETDDWCFDMVSGCVDNYRKGGKYCYNAYGISYWTASDCIKLKKYLTEAYAKEDGKDIFWEFIPLISKKSEFNVEIRVCSKTDIIEIDNFYELVQLDHSYENYSGNEK